MSKTHWYAPYHGTFDTIVTAPDVEPFLCVKFNIEYAPFIRGAIIAMLQRQMWNGSTADIDAMLANVHQLLYMFGQNTDCPLPVELIEEFEVMASLCESLRYSNGKLQALCCGEWTDIDGQPLNAGVAQPGGGTPQPSVNGGCEIYHARMDNGSLWYLPALVNTGDTIQVTGLGGAGTCNGTSWFCPNGQIFLGGLCVGVAAPLAGDPAPALNHMALIAKVGSTYYDVSSGTLTIPAGISGGQVVFRINQTGCADIGGSYEFDVKVCNNQLGRYTHVFDFALGPGAWVPVPTVSGGWSAGKFIGQMTGTALENRIHLCLPAGAVVDKFSVTVNIDKTLSGGIEMDTYNTCPLTTFNATPYNQGLANGSTADRNFTLPITAVTIAGAVHDIQITATGSTVAAYSEILSVTFSGPGADPF